MPPELRARAHVEHCVTPACLERLHAAFADLWRRAPEVPDEDRLLFETAVVEIAANVIEHTERRESFDADVRLRVSPGLLEADVVDSGAFVPLDLDRDLPADDLATAGRGLPLARRAVHELRHHHDGEHNHWYLMRRWSTVP